MMPYINETDFVIKNKELVYPEIVTDGLQLYYDAKGKRDTDYHRDTMLDMSGNGNHGQLHNFVYEKHSGYKDGLVFDYIDDKLVRPALNLKPNDFTFMLNGNIISFSPDGTVKRVQDGKVIESKELGSTPNAQDLIDCIEYKGNILGDMENIIDGLYKTEILSGTEIFTDKADDSVVHVEMDGKSYQHAGSGKNLFIGEAVTHHRQSDNVHWEDFVLTYKRNSPDTHSGAVFKLNVKPGVTYNLSFECVVGKGDIRILDETESPIVRNNFSTGDFSIRFAPVGVLVHIVFTDSSVVNDNKIIKNIQIEEGSTTTEYEPPAPTPDHPIEIHSLNDFDVMSSVGKRNYWAIAKEPWHEHIRHLGGGVFTNARDPRAIALFKMSALEAPIGETYTLSFEINVSNEAIQFSNSRFCINGEVPRASHNNPTLVKHEWVKVYATFDYAIENSRYVHMYLSNVTDVDTFQIRKFKLEKGDITTDWTLAPEDITENDNHPLIDKINLLLDEPLRSVGDIKDRLFRDSDGIWKVERNVELIHPEDGTKTIEETYGVLDSPFYEILPQDDQDKLNNLRSFEDSNYVYATLPGRSNVLSERLKPTLHARFLYNNWYKEDRVINNLMIYNRALTNEEMLQNYKMIKRRWGM